MKLNFAPRVQAIVLLLLVATSSALAGIVGDRLLSDRSPDQVAPPAGARPEPGPWRWEPRVDVRYGERLYGALDLTAAQRAAIDSIVAEQHAQVRALNEEIRPRFRAIAEQTRGRIEGVLTEEQRARLRGLREERVRTMREGARQRGLRPDLPDRFDRPGRLNRPGPAAPDAHDAPGAPGDERMRRRDRPREGGPIDPAVRDTTRESAADDGAPGDAVAAAPPRNHVPRRSALS